MAVPKTIPMFLSMMFALLLGGCGGGGDDDGATSAPGAPVLDPVTYDIRQLVFSWPAVSGADYYRLLENPDGASGFSEVATNITALTYDHDISVHLQDWINASYILEACNSQGCTDSAAVTATDSTGPIGYFKAANAEGGDYFGWSMALSGDGSTLAVAARLEDSAATGVTAGGPTPAGDDDSAPDAGAVYVFTNAGGSWVQQAYIKALNTEAGDDFGWRLALSADGSTLAVSARREDSSATGIDGDDSDNSAGDSGAVYVYTESGGSWSQEAYIKPANTEAGDFFGYNLALSSDGNTLAVGAIGESSSASTIGGDDSLNDAGGAGAVYVFDRSGGPWIQQEYLKASNAEAGDSFGYFVDLSDSGDVLATSAIWEDSDGSAEGDNSVSDAGAAYVFTRSGAVWTQQDYVKAGNADIDDHFGGHVRLSGDGMTLAVGAATPDTGTIHGEDSGATGIDGDETDDSVSQSGAVYVFTESGGNWSQEAYIKASNTGLSDLFGFGIALSQDGSSLAVGARAEDGDATGIGGNEASNASTNSGAVYLYTRSSGVWSNTITYVKAANTGAGDSFGYALDLSDDAATLVVGAFSEDSAATGVGGDQTDNSAGISGAVYLY